MNLPTILLHSAVLIACLVTAILVNEFIAKKFHIPAKYSRKIIHFSGAIFVALSAIFFDFHLYYIVASFFTLFLYICRRRKFVSLSDRREKSYGEVLFPIGVLVTAILAPDGQSFIIAMLILGFSDTLAYLIGSHLRSPILIFRKTAAGAIAFMLSALIIALFVATPFQAALIAVIACLAELFSPYGLDNVAIPGVISLIFMLL